MTVSTTATRDQFTGDGVTVSLPTTFAFNAASEIKVTSRVILTGVETVLSITTHYTVAGGAYDTGTITVVDPATDFPSTVEWTVERVTPLSQETDWVEGDIFPAQSHERAADKLTFIAQERDDKADRSLRVPTTDAAAIDMELPNSVDRASLFLAFDADGEPIASAGVTPATVTVSGFGAALIDDTDAEEGRDTILDGVIDARGDIMVGGVGGVAEQLALGAAGTVLSSDGSDAVWATPEELETPLPRSYLAGLIVTWTSATELSVNKGVCRCGSAADQDLVNAKNTNAAFSKTFIAGWTAGDGNAGVITGALAAAADDWHFFLLVKQDGSAYDFGFDTDVEAANLIADNDVETALGANCYYRRLMTFRSDATPEIPAFVQKPGDRFMLVVPILGYSVNTHDFEGGTGPGPITIDDYPGGVETTGLFRVLMTDCLVDSGLVLAPSYETLATPSLTTAPLITLVAASTDDPVAMELEIDVDTSRQFQVEALTDDQISLDVLVRGWIDRRGRDD